MGRQRNLVIAAEGVRALVENSVPHFQVACHIFGGDATNSKVWRGSKVHATEMRSVYLLDSSALVPGNTVLSATSHENFLGDLQVA